MEQKRKSFTVGLLVLFIFVPIFTPESKAFVSEPFFSLTVTYPNCGGPPCYEWVDPFCLNFSKIGIDCLSLPKLPYYWYESVFEYPGPYPIPVYENGGYDIIAITSGWDFEWAAYERYSTPAIIPNGMNFNQYSNSEFDYLATLYDQAINWEDKIPLLEEMQQILYLDIPSIGVFHENNLFLVNNEITGYDLELWYKDKSHLATWNYGNKTTLRICKEFNGAIVAHPYFLSDYYDLGLFEQIYTGLLTHENETHLWTPCIINDYSTIDRMNWTFHLNPNSKWADGENVTVDDILFSYQSMLTPFNLDLYPLPQNYPYFKLINYMDNDSISIINNQTIEFSLTNFHHNAEELFTLPIIPSHIYKPISQGGTGPEFIDWYDQALLWAETEPDKIFGTGAFRLSSWNVSERIVHLEKNPYYKNLTYGFDSTIEEVIYYHNIGFPEYFDEFNNGNCDFISEDLSVTWGILNDEFENGTIHKASSGLLAEVAFNMYHPYFGTGELCPIAGLESARHVRQAINCLLNRNYLMEIDSRIQGTGTPTATTFSDISIGYNSSIVPDSFSIANAINHMKAAGFDIEYSAPSTNIIGNNFVVVITILGLAGCCIIFTSKTKNCLF